MNQETNKRMIMSYLDLMSTYHNQTKRNYLQRVIEHDKAKCAEVAIKYGKDYWDGDRKYGFGGNYYDGRWKPFAQKMVDHYGLKPGTKILEVGCGKGFLLYEFTQVLPNVEVAGIDISEYALENAKPEIKNNLTLTSADNLPYADKTFDFVFSVMTLHNLYNYQLHKALQEIERVGKNNKYIVVESYRNEQEKANLLYWQLTCRIFSTPQEWEWFYKLSGYTGDYSFAFFE